MPPAIISAMIRSEPCEQIMAQTVLQSGCAVYYEHVIGSGGQSVREREGELASELGQLQTKVADHQVRIDLVCHICYGFVNDQIFF